ncbi:hypothetical protein POV27_08505 [Aureisphaera galaxeae]|uniref:hypothetical protein n=1 Tax=Aureisphaera galaxeae TaxID=1538023 RepID=UPI002350B892|nr:hypothetical protein [Aureisphaera galaxeae]MDC8004092.1 hypothetical protein [Aureisphaera galaxeae]
MRKIVYGLLLSVTILSCTSDDGANDSEDNYASFLSDTSIETDIDFMPEETYEVFDGTPQVPSLKLKLVTTEIYPCVNYTLATTTFVRDTELIVRFDEVIEPVFCLTAIGPAGVYLDLPEDIERITLINGESIDKYTIETNMDKVEIRLIERNFTNLLFENTFRLPENSFAYVCGTNIDNTQLYDDFKNILLSNAALTEITFNGEGRIPYPESSSGHGVDHPSVFFQYTDESIFDELGEVLDDFASQYLEGEIGVTMRLDSWKNKRHASWD